MSTPIGNRPLSLATHLRTAASNILAGSVTYDWKEQANCNCGQLVRCITGKSRDQIDDALEPLIAKQKTIRDSNDRELCTWRGLVNDFCPLNPGMPAPAFFQYLFGAGLQHGDFGHLERLTHPDILARMPKLTYTEVKHVKVKTGWFSSRTDTVKETKPVTQFRHDSGTHAAHYMNTWAALIEEYHASLAQAAQPKSESAAVPTDAALEAVETRPLVS